VVTVTTPGRYDVEITAETRETTGIYVAEL
jgi:hypothetical protein